MTAPCLNVPCSTPPLPTPAVCLRASYTSIHCDPHIQSHSYSNTNVLYLNVSRGTYPPYINFQLTLFKRYSKLPPERFLFVHTGYILKNQLVVSKLKNLILSLMAVEAELRGGEKEDLSAAIASLKKAVEKLK